MKIFILTALVVLLAVPIFAQEGFSEDIITRLVDRHNVYRQEQKVKDIKWSDELANKAQIWADSLAVNEKLIHSNFGYGENIFMATYSVVPEKVIDYWAKERKYYHGEPITQYNYALIANFTQIIWAKTVSVGCAVAISESGNYYWVCEYDPKGNIPDKKPVKKYKWAKK